MVSSTGTPSFWRLRASATTALAPQLWPYRMMRAARFCSVGQVAVAACAKKMQNQIVGVAHAAVFECFDVNGGGVVFSQASRDLHGAVDSVVVTHESAKKSENDDGSEKRQERARTLQQPLSGGASAAFDVGLSALTHITGKHNSTRWPGFENTASVCVPGESNLRTSR